MPEDITDTERQKQRDLEYCIAWEKLSPEFKSKLAEMGIIDPAVKVDSNGLIVDTDRGKESTGYIADAVEWLARDTHNAFCPDLIAEIERFEDTLAEKFGLSKPQSANVAEYFKSKLAELVIQSESLTLSRIVSLLISSSGNILACIHGLGHASRLAAHNGFPSMRASAKEIGVSHEHIRKQALKWVKLLNLPPLEGSKSAEACEKYKINAQTNHWRNQIYG